MKYYIDNDKMSGGGPDRRLHPLPAEDHEALSQADEAETAAADRPVTGSPCGGSPSLNPLQEAS